MHSIAILSSRIGGGYTQRCSYLLCSRPAPGSVARTCSDRVAAMQLCQCYKEQATAGMVLFKACGLVLSGRLAGRAQRGNSSTLSGSRLKRQCGSVGSGGRGRRHSWDVGARSVGAPHPPRAQPAGRLPAAAPQDSHHSPRHSPGACRIQAAGCTHSTQHAVASGTCSCTSHNR